MLREQLRSVLREDGRNTGGEDGQDPSLQLLLHDGQVKVLRKSESRERKRGREERPSTAGGAVVMPSRGKGACLEEGSTYG